MGAEGLAPLLLFVALLRFVTLFDFRSNPDLLVGESLATTNFLVCFVAALPLIAAFRLFRRKSY